MLTLERCFLLLLLLLLLSRHGYLPNLLLGLQASSGALVLLEELSCTFVSKINLFLINHFTFFRYCWTAVKKPMTTSLRAL